MTPDLAVAGLTHDLSGADQNELAPPIMQARLLPLTLSAKPLAVLRIAR
jgi:hypothetical protein